MSDIYSQHGWTPPVGTGPPGTRVGLTVASMVCAMLFTVLSDRPVASVLGVVWSTAQAGVVAQTLRERRAARTRTVARVVGTPS